MANRAWAIKLGSGGSCVDFCENRNIVGVGWQGMDQKILEQGDLEALWSHVRDTFKYAAPRQVSAAVGQIKRFWLDCSVGDYVVYYDPPKKQVRICRVISEPNFRDFDLTEKTDIWLYRKVEYVGTPISILDFYAGLKGSLLGPRMSFWEMNYELVHQVAQGKDPSLTSAPDGEIQAAYASLQKLLRKRVEALNESDWERLVVDYFRYQGATVDERHIGGSQPIIDFEAKFTFGEFHEEVWRVQVKRYQDRPVDWEEVERYYKLANTEYFCFVSMFGFTPRTWENAEDNKFQIRLLEAESFASFLLSGRYRAQLQTKLKLAV